jgi:hypothetical protein
VIPWDDFLAQRIKTIIEQNSFGALAAFQDRVISTRRNVLANAMIKNVTVIRLKLVELLNGHLTAEGFNLPALFKLPAAEYQAKAEELLSIAGTVIEEFVASGKKSKELIVSGFEASPKGMPGKTMTFVRGDGSEQNFHVLF